MKGGCETIVQSVSRVLEDPSSDPKDTWTVLVDFSNAFNCIDRSKIFEEIRARIPSLALWMEYCYGGQLFLHLGDTIIRSCCGVQQGDPLGPLGFALALQPIVDSIQAKVPNLKLNAWFLDDGVLIGSPADLSLALAIIEQEGPPRGLRLNRSKCLFFSSDPDSPPDNSLLQEIPRAEEGFSLLGCPVGPPPFCNTILLQRVEKIREFLKKLPDLQDSQMESTLLRHCLSLPKIFYSLRTCPPDFVREATTVFDDLIRDTLSDIAGGPLSDWSWRKASLPVSLGGLGLRNASTTAPAAYISSTSETKESVEALLQSPPQPLHLDHAINELSKLADRPDWDSLESIEVPLHQRTLSQLVDKVSYELLLSSAPDVRFRALALSSSLPHAGAWLHVVPSSSLGLHLSDREFRPCLQYWLGLRMSSEESPCSVCKRPADPFGDHDVGCGGNGDRIFRHNAISDVISSAAQTAALCPRKEAPCLVPGSSSRPADIYLPIWERGQPAAMDVTVISPLQQLTLSGASSIAGHALQVAEVRKRAAHAEACCSAGISFIPLAMETIGGLSHELINTIKCISRMQANRLGTSPSDAFRQLVQRLSIALRRCNAWSWINRQPIVPAYVDGRI